MQGIVMQVTEGYFDFIGAEVVDFDQDSHVAAVRVWRRARRLLRHRVAIPNVSAGTIPKARALS